MRRLLIHLPNALKKKSEAKNIKNRLIVSPFLSWFENVTDPIKDYTCLVQISLIAE
jgi:hypothetical protein